MWPGKWPKSDPKMDPKSDQKWSKSGQNRQKWAKTAISAPGDTVFAVFTCKIVVFEQKLPKLTILHVKPVSENGPTFLVTFWVIFWSLFEHFLGHFLGHFLVGFPVYCKLNCVRNVTRKVTKKWSKKWPKMIKKWLTFDQKSRFFNISWNVTKKWPIFDDFRQISVILS